jgi:Uma2 family endonuclease
MPVELALEPSIPVDPPRKRWTREECRSLESTGLWDLDKLELIEGDLITKVSKNRPHTISYVRLMSWLAQVFGALHLNPESPIDVSPEDNPTSNPGPDFAVLAKAADAYTTNNPPPSDVRLLIEISDSTLAFDLGPKARLYARAAIADYWVVDLAARRIVVHRNPANGMYSAVTAYAETETLSPLTAPSVLLNVASVLPPRP